MMTSAMRVLVILVLTFTDMAIQSDVTSVSDDEGRRVQSAGKTSLPHDLPSSCFPGHPCTHTPDQTSQGATPTTANENLYTAVYVVHGTCSHDPKTASGQEIPQTKDLPQEKPTVDEKSQHNTEQRRRTREPLPTPRAPQTPQHQARRKKPPKSQEKIRVAKRPGARRKSERRKIKRRKNRRRKRNKPQNNPQRSNDWRETEFENPRNKDHSENQYKADITTTTTTPTTSEADCSFADVIDDDDITRSTTIPGDDDDADDAAAGRDVQDHRRYHPNPNPNPNLQSLTKHPADIENPWWWFPWAGLLAFVVTVVVCLCVVTCCNKCRRLRTLDPDGGGGGGNVIRMREAWR